MMKLFHSSSADCSRIVTETYSTSFSSAIGRLHKDLRQPIYNIYGFVRLADEIVDTFHDHDKAELLAELKKQTFDAIERGISINPILNSFQRTVSEYNIPLELINSFLQSMQMDLHKSRYDRTGYDEYIYGSAETVGLMCLTVFCEKDHELIDELKDAARALGAAFQKVNFLRDIKDDYNGLARVYFPGCDFNNFSEQDKKNIEGEIYDDFDRARAGILKLPVKARFGVYVAYKYYLSLFKRIQKMHPSKVLEKRIRIPGYYKALIILRANVKNQLRMI
jgi:phytoene synthase